MNFNNKKTVIITIDCEHDCPPYLTSYRGIEEGVPKLLSLFDSKSIHSTFFITGDVAEKYHNIVKHISDRGHEIGSHGNTHKSFELMSRPEAYEEIEKSVAILSKFQEIVSFRAPYLKFPEKYYSILSKNNIKYDSSQCRYKKPKTKKISMRNGVLTLPTSITSSLLRLPLKLITPWISHINPLILFVHPWEFVDLRKKNLRIDCKFNTGEIALSQLSSWIDFLQSDNYHFSTIKEFGMTHANQLYSTTTQTY